jgi:hypothetical protein
VTIRGHNAERYEFPEPLLAEELFLVAVITNETDERFCISNAISELQSTSGRLASRANATSTSSRKISRFDVDSNYLNGNPVALAQRSTLSPYSFTTTNGNEHFATFKTGIFNTLPTASSPSYIDILKDKDILVEVRKSWTDEVNSDWSRTFLAFFTAECVFVGMFIAFCVIMFFFLQCRPKPLTKKAIATDI